MGFELRKSGVASVSLWPGAVQTELVNQFVLDKDATRSDGFQVDTSYAEQWLLFFPFFSSNETTLHPLDERRLCQRRDNRNERKMHRPPGKR